MQKTFDQDGGESPEKLVNSLTFRLRNHRLWDSLSIFLPPVVVSIYLAAYLYHLGWIALTTFLLSSIAAAALLVIGLIIRCRPLTPSARSAARLIDDRTGAKDRFITLATVEPAACSPLFFRRLRLEAARYAARIDLKREFPYKVKRSFYQSLGVSLLVGILLHFFLPNVQSSIHPVPARERIHELAQKMMQRPKLVDLARELQKLENKLDELKASQTDKQATIQEVEKKIENENRKPQEQQDQDLLGQAASALKNLEQQQSAGENGEQNQNKGGGVQSDTQQEGKGDAKQSQGSGGDNKRDLSAQQNKDMQQGKSASGDPKEKGSERNQQTKGDEKGKQADSNSPGGNESKEAAGKTQGKNEEAGGRDKASEETPRGAPPTDRFYQAGEKGREGIKDARYVTVELPEEIAADSKGNPTSLRNSKETKNRPKVPLSNVPLPAHVPDAPTETQQMPLEYRGMIR